MTTRRQFLHGSAALLGTSAFGLPRVAHASVPNHKLIVLFARGGWDTTRLFELPSTIASLQGDPGTTLEEANGIPFVHHPSRSNVYDFFERYGDVTGVINGMLVRSVNHKVCERLVLTGSSRPEVPDWPSILGSQAASAHALPSVVLSGPSSPGPLHRYSSIVGSADQLQSLLDRGVFDRADDAIQAPDESVLEKVDALLAARVSDQLQAATDPGEFRILDAMDDGLARISRLRDDARQVAFEGATMRQQLRTAVSMLRDGITRCVTMAMKGFDTHSFVVDQNPMLHEFFGHASELMELLRSSPGTGAGNTLADETTVLLVSEMGRAPYLTSREGKDHWPYTAALLIGAGVRGGQLIGAHDSFLNAKPVNLVTGGLESTGTVITPKHLGATLLGIAGVPTADWLDGIDPVRALMAT